ALMTGVVVPDDAGGTDAVEEAFADVEGVESVGVENVTLI
ncbi:MAG: elongation factor 1-beta, partial [Halobacteriales archaeon]|nr:elongation factor 1-beta [Halobacteriales archaeon]